jgi:pimeloyl-ACP methyl ester carboxylesterase
MDRDVVIVAQSMGGIVAVLAALARPERMQRLVLTATPGGVDVHRFGASDWRPDYRREYAHAAAWIFDVSVDVTDQLDAITAPTLLLWGDADPISPVTVGRHLATLLPHAELVVIPGGDHALARDRADEVAAHIARHLGDEY